MSDVGTVSPAARRFLVGLRTVNGVEHDEHDGLSPVRSNDVGIFGLSRIIYALGAVGAVFTLITKLMLNAEIANLRADMERFRGEVRAQIVPSNDVMTRKEAELTKTARDREIRELQAIDVETRLRLETVEARTRELERLNDQHGWKR